MRQGHTIGHVPTIVDGETLPDDVLEGRNWQKLGDRKFAHWQNQGWLQQSKLALQPMRTIGNLVRCGHSISALRVFPGKTATYRREIDALTHLVFTPPKARRKPLEERLPRRPGKGTAQLRFLVSRGLADQQDPTRHWSSTTTGLCICGQRSHARNLVRCS